MKTIFHGSENIIEKPEFGKGKTYNDYGLGFYCTESLDMAKEWAVDINRDGYANTYHLDDANLTILDLNDTKYTILHWLMILLENRTFDIPSLLANEGREYILKYFRVSYRDFDIIKGYRADDSYFSFAQDFLNGTISYRQLAKAMKLGHLGQQYVLKSKKAFEAIIYEGNEKVLSQIWYPKRILRDKSARAEYLDFHKNKRQHGDIYISDILDEEIKENDLRLR